MQFGGRYLVHSPRPTVWAALNNTAVLKACIPGCRRIEWTGPDSLELEVEVNLGLLRPTVRGDLTLTNVVPAKSYTLSGRGRGALLGVAQAAADITLTDQQRGTELFFTASGSASGAIMNLGMAIIGNSAQRVIDGFFEGFGTAMGAEVTVLTPQQRQILTNR
jgi:carbon monoxide dehydrogenase subunit G